ncbi:polysaccharide pyruvyl transferase family protein [Glaciibacter superstes]|uniref:polysaccharide pyruvyl transferase family protein n=1 Tax=Glaciibacter superstes TaxID=501023 RepID=UPI0003B6A9A7|nr:polysaccharide pyruvyl transferase family protein [Glaciibacter superstes]
MKALVLWADSHSPNLGVRSLAAGTAALVAQVWPGCEIVFHNFGRPIRQLPVGRFRSLARERVTGRHGMQRWLGNFDVVIDTRSGDSFTDIYGLRRLSMMCAVAECATEAGTPVVLGPQTIGPFDSRRGRRLAGFSLRRAALVMARDSESARYAVKLGRPVDTLTTDVVFAIPVPSVAHTRDVVLNASGLLWQENSHVDSERYRHTIRRLLRTLLESGREVSLLAHVLDSPSSDNDLYAVRSLAESAGSSVEVIEPTSLERSRAVVASASVVIGSRMHACLNALSVGVPAIPLAYSRKFAPLLEDLGWAATVDMRTAEDPVGEVLAYLDAPGLASGVSDVTERAAVSLQRARLGLRALV